MSHLIQGLATLGILVLAGAWGVLAYQRRRPALIVSVLLASASCCALGLFLSVVLHVSAFATGATLVLFVILVVLLLGRLGQRNGPADNFDQVHERNRKAAAYRRGTRLK